jgi:osmoprotectant transport system permease protein
MLAQEEPFIDWGWVGDNTDKIQEYTIQHLQLTAVAVGIGFGLAMVMALVSVRWRFTYAPLAALCGVFYAIPSLALFGMLVPILGLGLVPAEIALVSYTLLILLRNIVAGLDGVPDAAKEAADGMGYEPWRRVASVDLPLALPAIIAGLRIATVTTVGLVTVTVYVDQGGYGQFILEGLSRNGFMTEIMLGMVLSVAMAIAFDLVFVGIERVATPWARVATDRGGRDDA